VKEGRQSGWQAPAGDIRMADVASAAGVAVSTVSRALSRPERVNARTRERIIEAARKLSYTPNATARSLRLGASQTVMVVVPGRSTSPVFTELLSGIDAAMTAANYRLIMGRMDRAAEAGRYILDPSLSGSVDGALIVSSNVPQIAERSLADTGIPLVGVMHDLSPAGIPSVLIRDRDCAEAATSYLMGLGHRDLLYIAGTADGYHDALRHRGVIDALAKGGLPASCVRRFQGDYSFESGVEAARYYLSLERRPTAAIGCNDEMAIGFMKVVRSHGVRVPADLSVMGFDGISFSEYCEPTLSVVRQPFFEIGETAAEMLLKLMNGAMPGSLTTFHECELLARDSTARAPGRGKRMS
jgi:LacI family repressor for deo operon, udp, cdd, tsx, nupC, and nupG